jgi:hypothetical protein
LAETVNVIFCCDCASAQTTCSVSNMKGGSQ